MNEFNEFLRKIFKDLLPDVVNAATDVIKESLNPKVYTYDEFKSILLNMSRDNGGDVKKIVVDELSIGEIKTWFSKSIIDANQRGIVFYPTQENTGKWNIKMPENKNQIVQILYDIQKNTVVAYREIAFGELNDKLNALLNSNNGILIISK